MMELCVKEWENRAADAVDSAAIWEGLGGVLLESGKECTEETVSRIQEDASAPVLDR